MGVSKDGHVWLIARGAQNASFRRAYLAELDGATPQIDDEVAVTGFEGSAWFIGKIVEIGVGSGKQRTTMMCVTLLTISMH